MVQLSATYLLTLRCRILFEKLTVTQLVKKYPALFWNPKIHYRVHKDPPLFPVLTQSTPSHPTAVRSVLILSSHLRLGLPSGLFYSDFPMKILQTFLISPVLPCVLHAQHTY